MKWEATEGLIDLLDEGLKELNNEAQKRDQGKFDKDFYGLTTSQIMFKQSQNKARLPSKTAMLTTTLCDPTHTDLGTAG